MVLLCIGIALYYQSGGEARSFWIVLILPALGAGAYAIFGVLPVAIHELGHYVLGKLTGFRFSGIRIALFDWAIVDKRIRFKFTSGAVRGHVMPVSFSGRARWQVMLMTLGGALASLVAGVVAAAIALRMPSGALASWTLMWATLNLWYAGLSWYPKLKRNDLATVREYMGRKGAIRFRINQIIQDGDWVNRRPGEWNLHDLESLVRELDQPEMGPWLNNMLYAYHFDRHEREQARQCLLSAMDNIRALTGQWAIYRNDLLLEGIWFFGGFDEDRARVRDLHRQVSGLSPNDRSTALRALVAGRVAEGDWPGAKRAFQRALGRLPSDSAHAEVHVDWLRRLEARHEGLKTEIDCLPQ